MNEVRYQHIWGNNWPNDIAPSLPPEVTQWPTSAFNSILGYDNRQPVLQSVPRELTELSQKFEARMMLAAYNRGLYIPSKEEWIGLNLLERDDQLPRR